MLSTRPPRVIPAPQSCAIAARAHGAARLLRARQRSALRWRCRATRSPAAARCATRRRSRSACTLLFALRGAAYRRPPTASWTTRFRASARRLAALRALAAARRTHARRRSRSRPPALTRLPWATLPLPTAARCARRLRPWSCPAFASRSRAPRASRLRTRAARRPVDAGELDAFARETETVAAAFPRARCSRAPTRRPSVSSGWRPGAVDPFRRARRLARRRPLESGAAPRRPLAARGRAGRAPDRRPLGDPVRLPHRPRAGAPGEEWFGLARSFLLAGAGAVVAAQWDVDDAATAELMARLYGHLGAGCRSQGTFANSAATARRGRASTGLGRIRGPGRTRPVEPGWHPRTAPAV